jgi:hypothetical protein
VNASPVDPKEGRFDRAANLLRVAAIAVVVLCACSLLVHAREPDAALGDQLAWAAVAVLLVVPLLRVAWLGVRWLRRGDVRFALVALGVLLVVATGALLA